MYLDKEYINVQSKNDVSKKAQIDGAKIIYLKKPQTILVEVKDLTCKKKIMNS